MAKNKKLLCQECGGGGDITDDNIGGYDVGYSCGYCKGKGYLSAKQRGEWLRHQKEFKTEKLKRK